MWTSGWRITSTRTVRWQRSFPPRGTTLPWRLLQTGAPVYDADGYLQKGVIVRHLDLPGHVADSKAVLRRLAALREETGIEFIPSLMSQFTPFYKAAEHGLGRRITTYEYRQVIDEAVRLGLTDGYMQEKSSAREEYTPPFDLEGV